MGGAQAIAALAFGTESVQAVDVIVGPGNPYVQEAKRQLVGPVGIDGIAGPSELVVIAAGAGADRSSSPSTSWLRPSTVRTALFGASRRRPRSWTPCPRSGRLWPKRGSVANAEVQLFDVPDAAAALAGAEEIAPEHLQLIGDEAEALAERVRNAGCVFVGAGAGTAFGDYVAGSNHVLPTGGAARFQRSRRPRSGGGWLAYPCPARPPPASRPRAPHWRVPRAFLCTESMERRA